MSLRDFYTVSFEKVWPNFEGVLEAFGLSYENHSKWQIKVLLSSWLIFRGQLNCLLDWRSLSSYSTLRCKTIATVDPWSVNGSFICKNNLLSLYNLIIAVTVSDEYSHLEVLATEDMIMINVMRVKECKVEVA